MTDVPINPGERRAPGIPLPHKVNDGALATVPNLPVDRSSSWLSPARLENFRDGFRWAQEALGQRIPMTGESN